MVHKPPPHNKNDFTEWLGKTRKDWRVYWDDHVVLELEPYLVEYDLSWFVDLERPTFGNAAKDPENLADVNTIKLWQKVDRQIYAAGFACVAIPSLLLYILVKVACCFCCGKAASKDK